MFEELNRTRDFSESEKWEVLLGIRLLGTTFWGGLSNHQAATAQMHLVENKYRRVPTLSVSIPEVHTWIPIIRHHP